MNPSTNESKPITINQNLCIMHSKSLTEMHEAIYGNAHPENGLIWIAKENRRMILELQEFVDSIKRWSSQIVVFLICSGVAALGTFMIQVYKFLVEHGRI